MNIISLPIDALTPDPQNAKDHPDDQIEQIKESIRMFGNNDPIGIWGDDNIIVEGHGRWQALQELGYTECECIRLDHLSDEERRAYALVHNQTTMTSGFIPPVLEEVLSEIHGIDMGIFGFTVPGDEENQNGPVIEDDVPTTVEARSEPGQIWQLGKHRLVCGDCTDVTVIEKLMDGDYADLYLTDPPYNVDYEGVAGTIANDNMTDDAFKSFLENAFSVAQHVMKPGAAYYIWHAIMNTDIVKSACKKADLPAKQILIWNKNTFALGRQDYQWKHEPCVYGWKEGAAHYFIDDRAQSTVISDRAEIHPRSMKKDQLVALVEELLEDPVSTTVLNEDEPALNDIHPTMKPVKLFARLIKNSSKPGDIVLDTFCGGGTTIIACEQLNRRCYAVELEPHYADVIIQRWEDFTHKKAQLIGTI